MPEWLGISDMSDVSHTLAKWVFFQHFSSIQLPSSGNGGCMTPKHWKDSSHLASVCDMFDMYSCGCMCVGLACKCTD